MSSLRSRLVREYASEFGLESLFPLPAGRLATRNSQSRTSPLATGTPEAEDLELGTRRLSQCRVQYHTLYSYTVLGTLSLELAYQVTLRGLWL